MIRRLALLAAALAVAAVTAGPSLAVTTRGVAVKDDYFKPKLVTIMKGTRVVWTWRGEGRHNVVAAQGPSEFRSKIKREGTYGHTFKKTGTWQIVCTVHPGMNMKVVVKKQL